jgi:hypothetical protein
LPAVPATKHARNFSVTDDLQEIRVCGWVADAFPGVELVIINAELD